jgi:glycopeptide antibiotics resistance protein
MLPLRNAGVWRALSVVILVLVLIGALSPAIWFFDDKRDALAWLKNADKVIHALTFITLSIWFSGLYDQRAWWRIGIGLMSFGFLIEFFQLQVGYRTADWFDIAANTVGIIIGLTVATAGLKGWALRFEDWYSRRHRI